MFDRDVLYHIAKRKGKNIPPGLSRLRPFIVLTSPGNCGIIPPVRISGGEWCGRRLKVPAGDKVRPTQDRVRAALFSMIAAELPGAKLLDLYAGSGSFGLDALSRGAESVTWVEADKSVLGFLRQNVEELARDCRTEIFAADVLKWVKSLGKERQYDIVFADPPYLKVEESTFKPLMEALAAEKCLMVGGLFIGEMSSRTRVTELSGWELLRDRNYGHTRVGIWRLVDTKTEEK